MLKFVTVATLLASTAIAHAACPGTHSFTAANGKTVCVLAPLAADAPDSTVGACVLRSSSGKIQGVMSNVTKSDCTRERGQMYDSREDN